MFKLNGQFITVIGLLQFTTHTPKYRAAQKLMKDKKEIKKQLEKAEGLLQTLSDMHSDCKTLVSQYFWERRKKRWESIF